MQPGEPFGSDEARRRLEAALSSLRSAIEASTYERLDAGAVLDAAEGVLRLELAEGAIPEVTENGEVHVPFLGPPEGVEASLTVGNSAGYGMVAGLEVTLHPTAGSYFLDGSVREDARCAIRAFRDLKTQELSKLVLMTSLDPDGRAMKEAGLTLDRGKVVLGVTYCYDADDPSNSSMNAHGFQNGTVANWQVPVQLDGSVLRGEDARRLAGKIYERHSAIKIPGDGR